MDWNLGEDNINQTNPNWSGSSSFQVNPNNGQVVGPDSSSYYGLEKFEPYKDQINQLLQQNDTPEDALSMLKRYAEEDDAYKELYAQALLERENQERAYQWYEDFNKSYYQRTAKDLEAAGLNPWLALQSLGSSGTGSLSAAGSFSGSTGSSAKVRRQEIQSQNTQKAITATFSVIGAIIGAIIMALA